MHYYFREQTINFDNKVGCIFTFLIMGLLSACNIEPQNQQAQQQHFICKSLIEGFLKAENLGHYEIHKFQPTLHRPTIEREYFYTVAVDHRIKLNIPRQNKLRFNCQHNGNQRYTVQMYNPELRSLQNLISLDLPPQKTIQKLTTFALHNQ